MEVDEYYLYSLEIRRITIDIMKDLVDKTLNDKDIEQRYIKFLKCNACLSCKRKVAILRESSTNRKDIINCKGEIENAIDECTGVCPDFIMDKWTEMCIILYTMRAFIGENQQIMDKMIIFAEKIINMAKELSNELLNSISTIGIEKSPLIFNIEKWTKWIPKKEECKNEELKDYFG